MYKFFIRPLLFLLPPETAHSFTLALLKAVLKIPLMKFLVKSLFIAANPKLGRRVFGLDFPNPVGLAAGFDKNAKYIDELACLGFGFIEIGTVTPLPQPGNEKPRLFRFAKHRALINRMGFNNDGAQKIAQRLKKRKAAVIIGGNIGKNKTTPNEHAADDYLKCFEALFDCVDYFVVNVSSPNTPGLRELQNKEPLMKILYALQEKNNEKPQRKPILLKIAPDLTSSQLDDIVSIVTQAGIDGLVATNTTITHKELKANNEISDAVRNGGLSGLPLRDRATEVVRYLHQRTSLPIIAVGGIMDAADAAEKFKAGASLVQVYTGIIYEGPSIACKICKNI